MLHAFTVQDHVHMVRKSHWALLAALRVVEASPATAMSYLTVVWGLIVGYFFFSEVWSPDCTDHQLKHSMPLHSKQFCSDMHNCSTDHLHFLSLKSLGLISKSTDNDWEINIQKHYIIKQCSVYAECHMTAVVFQSCAYLVWHSLWCAQFLSDWHSLSGCVMCAHTPCSPFVFLLLLICITTHSLIYCIHAISGLDCWWSTVLHLALQISASLGNVSGFNNAGSVF